LRRISLLTAFHTDDPLETDFVGLTQAARAVELERTRLRWYDWTRYSSCQDALIQMGGLIGEIELDGAGLEPFWPYLWLGQWTHAGKGAVMGLGRYRLEMN
ncbi:MAG: CRISPR system precrRNA processing endoribonuclease RAMP protein Cas6, partial [Candidatus Competibacter sp.]|nr:CRISPR system precrRNA processing endoribonuclease RAMP protein Cas6 [Candidatus Competibacter sp.]